MNELQLHEATSNNEIQARDYRNFIGPQWINWFENNVYKYKIVVSIDFQ